MSHPATALKHSLGSDVNVIKDLSEVVSPIGFGRVDLGSATGIGARRSLNRGRVIVWEGLLGTQFHNLRPL